MGVVYAINTSLIGHDKMYKNHLRYKQEKMKNVGDYPHG